MKGLNTIKTNAKNFLKVAVFLGIINTTNNALAQNLSQNTTNKAQTEVNVVNSNNIITSNNPSKYAIENVAKYFPNMTPEMQDHLKKLKEHLDGPRGKIKTEQANKIFKSINRSPNYTEKQRIIFIASTIETEVIQEGTIFTDTYRAEDYTAEEQGYYDYFNTQYVTRFRGYAKEFNANLANLQAEIAKMKEEISQTKEEISQTKEEISQTKEEISQTDKRIEQHKQEINQMNEESKIRQKNITNIMNNFSKEQVLNDQNFYNLVKQTKEIAIKYKREITPHMQELFSVIK